MSENRKQVIDYLVNMAPDKLNHQLETQGQKEVIRLLDILKEFKKEFGPESDKDYMEKLRVAEALIELRIQGGNETVGEAEGFEIIGDTLTSFDPALDFVNNVCYIGIPLPCRIRGENSKGKKIENRILMISSAKEIFSLNQERCEERGIFYTSYPLIPETRWDRKEIDAFLNHDKKIRPKEILETIIERYRFFMDYHDERYYLFNALYDVYTYFHPLFSTQPIVFLHGDTKAGKTRTMKVKEQIAFNALHTPNLSPSAFFRLVEGARPTILFDEAEEFGYSDNISPLNAILLSGRGRNARVVRMEKDSSGNFRPVFFKTSSPCVMANIRGISNIALENRSIKLVLRPHKNNETADRDAENIDPIRHRIRQNLYLLLMTKWQEVEAVNSKLQRADGLSGRDFGLWKPILVMARFFEGYGAAGLYAEMLSFAQELVNNTKAGRIEGSFSSKVFQAVANLAQKKEWLDFYPSGGIYGEVLKVYQGTLPEWLTEQKVKNKIAKLALGSPKRESYEGKLQRGFWINKNDLKEQIVRSQLGDIIDGFDTLDGSSNEAGRNLRTLPTPISASNVSKVSHPSDLEF